MNLVRSVIKWLGVCLLISFSGPNVAVAGPPFLTDDPDPVPYQHWEFYTFATRDRTSSTNTVTGPALELNNGVAPNSQFHIIIPETYFSSGGMSASGIGDIEAGVKYRFLTETKHRPEIGTFPLLEFPSGDESRGLGNGRTWAKIPLWLERNVGAWTSYGGGGYAYNPAPGERNYFFGGFVLQRTICLRLTLGSEIFLQGAQAQSNHPESPAVSSISSEIQVPGTRSSALWNYGGFYNFTHDFSLLFSAGHSFSGEGNSIFYLALYRTWGPGSP
jgi:hypothetical protein